MKKLATFLLALLVLTGCGGRKNKPLFEHAGGTFRMCIGSELSTTRPNQIIDVHSALVISQVMEGLVSFNTKDLSIEPRLAESWKVSNDKTSYTFKIREDVLFHENEFLSSEADRKLTMEDIIFSFESLSKKDQHGNSTSAYASFFHGSIEGIDEFHEGTSKKISGISYKGQTLKIELQKPDANFLSKLAGVNAAIVSKKLAEAGKEDELIGTGPFKYDGTEQVDDRKQIVLSKNEDYYLSDEKGNALPYLDKIEFLIENKKLEELDLFEEGKTHYIEALPTSRISAMLEGRIKDFNSKPPLLILRNNPLLATNYYFFNMKDPRFQDIRVRQAFNYAIRRNRITQTILKGQAYENGIYGITPPISRQFRSYDFKAIKAVSYSYDPEKAKKLLAEAGYPNGEGFGTVTLRLNVGDVHAAVAEDFSYQIFQVLGIHVNIDASSFEQKRQDANYLKGDLFRTAWFADYVSPESFLTNFYGKIVPKSMSEASKMNQSRYVNPAFDRLFEAAKSEEKKSKRMELFAKAEVELMKDPPLIPLWYNGDIQLLYSKVRNLHENPLNYFDFRSVYLHEWTKEEYEKHVRKN
ncbi:MAG: peptide ABC transporter substrate-binding protein [Bacteroidetes bacterium]|nr:MAG: peptide ABC transporter substrate-binding protein [Bacteroidota bacterium]